MNYYIVELLNKDCVLKRQVFDTNFCIHDVYKYAYELAEKNCNKKYYVCIYHNSFDGYRKLTTIISSKYTRKNDDKVETKYDPKSGITFSTKL